MITITNIVGQKSETPAPAAGVGGLRQAVHAEIVPGAFLAITLAAEGLRIHHGPDGVFIPLADLILLAQAHAPALHPKVLTDQQAAVIVEMKAAKVRARDAQRNAAPRPPAHQPAEQREKGKQDNEATGLPAPLTPPPANPPNAPE